MANADFNKYYPHTLKVDEMVSDENNKNNNRKNLQNLQQFDDYICVFENTSIEYPEMALGLAYRSATTKGERKKYCEENGRGQGNEGRLYIRRDDWINPDEADYECGVFNLDGTRKKYNNPSQDPRKFPSTKLCDRYYDKDNGEDFYTKMIPSKLERPVIDLRAQDIEEEIRNDTRSKIFWITYSILTVFVIYWTAKYEVEKPYEFYDYIYSVFFNKAIILIFLFGFFIYTFCPFGTCYTNPDDALYKRDFNKAAKEFVCDFTNNNVGYLEEGFNLSYDNSSWMKMLDPIISVLFNVNRKMEVPLKFVNKQVCNYCTVKHPCIDRRPFNTMQISKPVVITVYSSVLAQDSDSSIKRDAIRKNYYAAINKKYKYIKIGNDSIPYDTGTIIHLKTDDDFNNQLYMCVLSMNGKMSTDRARRISGINAVDYVYQWIPVTDRNGPTIFNDDISNLRIKSCPYSYRIFSVGTNYELIGYNIPLSTRNFVSKFENNTDSYTEYPYFPAFTFDKLRGDKTFSKKPEFIKRKLIKIYKYLISYPSQKFRTKNVAIVGGNIVRYDSILAPNTNIQNVNLKNSFVKNNTYLSTCNKYINKLNELNNYFNDDEKDDEYLKYYYTPKSRDDEYNIVEKNYYDVTFYDMDIENIFKHLEIDSNDLNQRDFMFKFYQSVLHLNYVQRDRIRLKLTDKLIEKFTKERNKLLVPNKNLPSYLDEFYNNKNLQVSISKVITIKDGKDTVKLKKIHILEQIINEHHFEKKTYQQDGIVNECYFCKQRCKM